MPAVPPARQDANSEARESIKPPHLNSLREPGEAEARLEPVSAPELRLDPLEDTVATSPWAA